MVNTRISDLAAGAAVSGTDLFPNVQSAGTGPVKTTGTQLATYFWASPTLVTPNIGVATATTVNKVTVTAPATGSTLTLNDGTTLTQTASTTLTGGTLRKVLSGNTTYYVGRNLTTPVITNSGGNALVTCGAAHSCSIGDPVVLYVPSNMTACTISQANPVVVTMANTFAAGQPVKFSATETLPPPLLAGTTYYVIAAGLGGASFEVSTTVGGAAVNTTALTATFSNGSANITITGASTYIKVGQIVRFAGTSVVNFANATAYYVLTSAGNVITVSATATGTAITAGTVTTNGTLATSGNYYCETTGTLTNTITEGTVYYVGTTGFGTTAFQLTTTSGGSTYIAYGTTPTGGPIYGAYTGKDTNAGTSASPFLTLQAAANYVGNSLDIGVNTITIQVCDGTHLDGVAYGGDFLDTGGIVIFQGNMTTPQNCFINSTGNCFWFTGSSVTVQGFKVASSTGSGIRGDAGAAITANMMDWGLCAAATLLIEGSSILNMNSSTFYLSGVTPGIGHMYIISAATYSYNTNTLNILNTPVGNATTPYLYVDMGASGFVWALTVNGSAVMQKYLVQNCGVIQTWGSGVNIMPGNAAGSGTNPGVSPYGFYG